MPLEFWASGAISGNPTMRVAEKVFLGYFPVSYPYWYMYGKPSQVVEVDSPQAEARFRRRYPWVRARFIRKWRGESLL